MGTKMLDSVLGAAGILVSVLLFIVGYRQTVGAKKERTRGANTDVEKVVVRRIVLEGYAPTRADIARLLQGKARDFRVAEDELLSEGQLLNTVYTRIVESDLIPTDQREEILKRILPALAETEATPIDEDQARGAPIERMLWTSTALLGVIAGAASIAGGIVSVLPELSMTSTSFREIAIPALTTVAASLVLLTAMIAFYRLRASQEAVSSKAGQMNRYIAFEMEVSRAFKKLGVPIRRAERAEGADFIVEIRGQRILIEVKAWTVPMPSRIIADLAARLTANLERVGASEAVVVTPEPLRNRLPTPTDAKVRFMSLQELRNYATHSMEGGTAA